MLHLGEGVLRRMVDEPFSVSALRREHLAHCHQCQQKLDEISKDARFTTAVLRVEDIQPNCFGALQQVRSKMESRNLQPAASWRTWFSRRAMAYSGKSRTLTAASLAVVLVGSLAFTPAGSFAQSFITIFQAKHVAPIAVTTADLQSLPNLDKYGTTHLSGKLKPIKLSSVAAARTTAHYKVLAPAVLPSGVPHSATYTVIPGEAGTFTFSADKARTAGQGLKVASMPSRLNGSTLKVKVGTAVVAVYGSNAGIPPLVVGQMVAPQVSSTGVSVKEIENYVLGLPGVSPRLAASLRSISDPTSTLPIPIPIDKASSQTVEIHGVHGVLIGDSTGIGSIVIWQKGGMIYGVGGTQSQGSILTVANSLH